MEDLASGRVSGTLQCMRNVQQLPSSSRSGTSSHVHGPRLWELKICEDECLHILSSVYFENFGQVLQKGHMSEGAPGMQQGTKAAHKS